MAAEPETTRDKERFADALSRRLQIEFPSVHSTLWFQQVTGLRTKPHMDIQKASFRSKLVRIHRVPPAGVTVMPPYRLADMRADLALCVKWMRSNKCAIPVARHSNTVEVRGDQGWVLSVMVPRDDVPDNMTFDMLLMAVAAERGLMPWAVGGFKNSYTIA